jgi:hypothetical protein
MATTEILPFSQDVAANVLTQAQYLADAQRPLGNQPGIARSKLTNKALLQVSAICAGIGQWLADKQGTNVTDQLSAAALSTMMTAAVSSLVPTPVTVPRRQTILTGVAAPIVAGTGLACNLVATATPSRWSFAAGIGDSGAIDYVGKIAVDTTGFWTGLTNSTTNYLFVDQNVGTGAVTGIVSILPYIANDSSIAPSIVNGQHTYIHDQGQMYVGNGSVATAVRRTAVGQAVTAGGVVTSVINYAKLRRFDSGLLAVAASTGYTPRHALGILPDAITATVKAPARTEIPFFFLFTASYNGVVINLLDSLDIGYRTQAGVSTPESTPSSDGLAGPNFTQARVIVSTRW